MIRFGPYRAGPRAGPQARPTRGPADTEIPGRARAARRPAGTRRQQGRAVHDRVAGHRGHGLGARHLHPGDPAGAWGPGARSPGSSRRCTVVGTASLAQTMDEPAIGTGGRAATPVDRRRSLVEQREVDLLIDAFDRARRGNPSALPDQRRARGRKECRPGRSARPPARAGPRRGDVGQLRRAVRQRRAVPAAPRRPHATVPGSSRRPDDRRRSSDTRRCGSPSSRASLHHARRPRFSSGSWGRFGIGCCGS